MSVKIHLMLNSKMLIDANADANGDSIVATSLLEASNLVVLKVILVAILHIYIGQKKNSSHLQQNLNFCCLLYTTFDHATITRIHLLFIPMQIWEFMDKVF